MSKIYLKKSSNNILFWCPGCNHAHMISYGEGQWYWNGSYDKPTFSPSVLSKYKKLTEFGESERKEWNRLGYPKRSEPFETTTEICHSFITNGMIEFLSDCTHDLAGKTVTLPEYPKD